MLNLTYIAPFFIVSNINVSVSFYVNKLGFKIRYMGPEGDPFYAMVGRDNISIMLKAIAVDVTPIPNHTRHEWAPWDAYISTADPDKLYEEYSAGNVTFNRPLRDDDDGLRGFTVADADGYILFFGRPKP
jgi:catechol 2,3-dioxygenase-like lactoylglutathione lyase family enzyme